MPGWRAEGRRVLWWVLGVASTVMSALAIISLARHALLLRGLSTPLELILSGHAALLRGLLGWAERPLQDALTWLGQFIGSRPTLEAHWRDMLVVVAIWTGALVWARWREFTVRWSAAGHDGLFGFSHIVAFALAFLVLAVGGLLMVVITGILPLTSFDLAVQVGIAVSAWIVFGLVMWVGGLAKRQEAMGVLVFAGAAALATWWVAQALGHPAGSGIAGFGISVIAVGVMYLVLGVALVLSGKPFANSPAVYGLYILSGFVNAGVLWAIDWGVRRVLE
jgi:hypothetical protein